MMVVPVVYRAAKVGGLLAFKVDDGLADGGVIDDFGLGDSASDQRGGADLVNAARLALGPLGDALEGVVGELCVHAIGGISARTPHPCTVFGAATAFIASYK